MTSDHRDAKRQVVIVAAPPIIVFYLLAGVTSRGFKELVIPIFLFGFKFVVS